MFFIICIFCFVLSLLVWKFVIIGEGPPTYKNCWPFVGNTFTLLKCNTHERLMDELKKLADDCNEAGGVIRMFLGPKVFYHITDPEDASLIAKTNTTKHGFYDFGKKWMGNGLLTGSGSLWKYHKKLISPAFSLQVQLNFLDIINNQAKKFLHKLDSYVDKGPANLTTEFRIMTLQNVFFTFLKLPVDKDDNFFKKYMGAVDELLKIFITRFQSVPYHWDGIYNLTSLKKRQDNALKIINDLTDEIIQKRREINKIEASNNLNEKNPETHNKTLLDLLLDLNDEGKLSTDEMKHEINTVMVAALDTTSWVLTYMLVLLGTHTHIQDKVLEEIQEVLSEGEDNVERHHLTKLEYMEAVIKETLRLYTPVPITIRTLEEDTKLKNYTLAAGSDCFVSLCGIHRNKIWGHDTDVFRPERWLENNDFASYFAGFSLGRRNCIGKTYAMLSLKTTLTHFLRRYKVTANANDLRLEFDFVQKPVSGHFISLQLR